jgi:prepilin-type N-terminal cleavage/methylation domain-containing protein
MTVRARGLDQALNRPIAASPRCGRYSSAAPGFSLVELLVVLAIISVTAAIAVPRYGASIARFRVESAARRVGADLTYARSVARSSSASTTVSFNAATEVYVVAGAAHMNTRAAGYQVNLAADPYLATILSADFGGDGQVSFDGYGRPDDAGTVVVRNSAAQWQVTVQAESGAVSVQRVP